MINVKDPPYSAVGDGISDDTAAIQSALNTGGAIYFPSGQYKHGPLVAPFSGVKVYGDGIGATQLLPQSGGIHFLGQFCTVADMMIQPAAGHSGHVLDFDLGSVWLTTLCVIGGDNIIRFRGDTQTYISNVQATQFTGTCVEYGPAFAGMGFISNLRMAWVDDLNHGFGIIARSGDTFHWSNIDATALFCPIGLIPIDGNILCNVHAVNVTCDGVSRTNSLPGWFIDGSAGLLSRVRLVNCWAGTMCHDGFFIKNAADVSLVNHIAINNTLNGIHTCGTTTAKARMVTSIGNLGSPVLIDAPSVFSWNIN